MLKQFLNVEGSKSIVRVQFLVRLGKEQMRYMWLIEHFVVRQTAKGNELKIGLYASRIIF